MSAINNRSHGGHIDNAKLALSTIALMAVLAPTASEARDRPGTPNNERAYVCQSFNGSAAVCVNFDNTANEHVFFETEFTGNGVHVSPRPKAECLDRMPAPKNCKSNKLGCAINTIQQMKMACHAGRSFLGRRSGDESWGRTGATNRDDFFLPYPPEGFRVANLEPGTEYCFRFRARRVSDDVVSQNWSNWACATTPGDAEAEPQPQVSRPSPPSAVTAEFVPGGKDYRTHPPKVIVKWRPAKGAETYSIDKMQSGDLKAGGSYEPVTPGKGSDIELMQVFDELTSDETEIIESSGITYRVCAVNAAGKACSQKSTYAMLDGVQDQSHANSDDIATAPPPPTQVPPPEKSSPAPIPHAEDMVAVPDAIKVLVKPGKFGSKIMTK